ncbi:uncharacterized protein LOC123209203 [Mangifera indica]|uniref:uncharacterized protein LOC123209203 n=1 Tax=Mangifera indica TaxID=29780 RepID=UPI001CF9933E|nr:uncharacterized protein LOC123209203 [Mangifera indica]
MDSGANDHVISDLQQLSVQTNIQGNKSCKLEVGNACLSHIQDKESRAVLLHGILKNGLYQLHSIAPCSFSYLTENKELTLAGSAGGEFCKTSSKCTASQSVLSSNKIKNVAKPHCYD